MKNISKSDICKICKGWCCYLYKYNTDKLSIDERDQIKERIRKNHFGNDLSIYGVNPLKHDDFTKCEFLGENGCIIERTKRPKKCLDYECSALKNMDINMIPKER